MKRCRVCQEMAVAEGLCFGSQPVSNRFLIQQDEPEDRFALALGICHRCGVAQLTERMPELALEPRVDWIVYNEPEAHLDLLAETILRLPGLPRQAKAAGISVKDDSLL